jgi:hypothetical protein
MGLTELLSDLTLEHKMVTVRSQPARTCELIAISFTLQKLKRPFDTCDLLKLRTVLTTRDYASIEPYDPELLPFIEALQAARARYLALGDQPFGAAAQLTDTERALAIFREVWSTCSRIGTEGTKNCEHPLYLPPIYNNATLNQLLIKLVLAVRNRDTADGGVHRTGHFVIGGVEGTGKTTLLTALCIAVAVCSARYLLVYFDYGKGPSPSPTVSQLASELFIRHCAGCFEDKFGALRTLSNKASRALAQLDKAVATGAPVEPRESGAKTWSLETVFGNPFSRS